MSRSALLRALPLALLLVVPLIFFGPVLGGDQALVPVHTDELLPWQGEADEARLAEIRSRHQPLLMDTTICFHPHLVATMARLKAGEAPLWNPDLLAGVPLLAQAVHGALHPPLLLASLLPFPMAYGWLALLQTLIAGLLMYRLAREFDAPPWAACLAGLSFAFCGYVSVRFHFFQVHGAAIWLPGVLLGIERLFKGARWGAVACIALCVGCSLLAGFPQGRLHILYAGAAFGAVRFVAAWRAGGAARASGLRSGWAFALAMVLGLAIGAPQLLPAADMASDADSSRRAISTEEVASFAMRPTTLLAALSPDLFGMPSDLAAHALPHLRQDGVMRRLFCKPTGNFVENTSSFGLAPLLLALLGLSVRRRGAGLAGGLMLAGVLLSIDTPLLPWVLHLPGLDIGDPKRFLLLFAA
ncbi:MAG: YfhO family protein, partial [Planctomycetota bacterium]